METTSRVVDVVCVLGLGYIGLPTAAMFATHGKRVVGVDVSQRVLQTLASGGIHIEEPGLAEQVRRAFASGHLAVQSKPVAADAYIIAAPTPLGSGNSPDLRAVQAAAESLVPALRPGNLVILESTSPPGTTVGLTRILERSGLRVGDELLVAYSPERVLPGRILTELVENDRVIGGVTGAAAEAAADLYRAFVRGAIHLTDATTAEMVKLMENTFRDVNIALANELCRVAEVIGIDVHEAISLANHHPRVNILRPGPGVGGHCIAVDPWFIADAAPGVTELIQTARAVNDRQPQLVVELIEESVADLPNPEIAILGLAYKADVDDLRESPALEVVRLLEERGYRLRLHEPHATELPSGMPLHLDLDAALAGADLMVILTDHEEYRRLTPDDPAVRGLSLCRVIDTRNCLDRRFEDSIHFTIRRLGANLSARWERVRA